MAKATVLRCDACGTWDSDTVHVRTVGICGPRFELCSTCRLAKLVGMGVHEEDAARYVAVFDAQPITAGTHLSLSAGVKRYAELYPGQAPGQLSVLEDASEVEGPEWRDATANGAAVSDQAEFPGDAQVTVLLAGDAADHEPITVLTATPEQGETEPVAATSPRRRKGSAN